MITEAFLATFECEWLRHYQVPHRAQARTAVFDFIESFYNRRRHSTLGYLSLPTMRGDISPATLPGLNLSAEPGPLRSGSIRGPGVTVGSPERSLQD